MPSVEENVGIWDGDYEWHDEGEEWSEPWGNSTAQWYGCVYPRIQRFLPAGRILELAPGYGRWVDYLLPHCDSYIGVDLSTRCIEACTQRFATREKATFATNDGVTLPMVADASVDFVFCFDSFVHVEDETLASYCKELARVLTPDGVGFIHHSNMGAYRRLANLAAPLGLLRLPARVRLQLDHVGIVSNTRWRGLSVTAPRFVELAESAGLHTVGQELINWGGGALLIDAMSVVTRPGSRWDRPNRVVKNRLFGMDARAIRRSDTVYDTSSAASA
jgi:SAM-dependent methyltransferase